MDERESVWKCISGHHFDRLFKCCQNVARKKWEIKAILTLNLAEIKDSLINYLLIWPEIDAPGDFNKKQSEWMDCYYIYYSLRQHDLSSVPQLTFCLLIMYWWTAHLVASVYNATRTPLWAGGALWWHLSINM